MVPEAVRNSRSVVIINGSPTEMDELADVMVEGSISDLLPDIVAS